MKTGDGRRCVSSASAAVALSSLTAAAASACWQKRNGLNHNNSTFALLITKQLITTLEKYENKTTRINKDTATMPKKHN